MRLRGTRVCGLVWLAVLSACASSSNAPVDFGYGLGEDVQRSGRGALGVRWHRTLTEAKRGAYVPVETAVAAIDPRTGGLFVPSVGGSLFAFSAEGEQIYRLEVGAPMESEPALDPDEDELYFGTERGQLFALEASRGVIRWRVTATGSLRRKPVLTDDAVFVISENDVVEAFAREDGSLLWRYEREPLEGFLVAGHAGITRVDNLLYTAFNDGAVVCLDALDGRPRWVQETARDAPVVEPGLPQYLDVDTTPLVQDGVVYAASFAAGLYALDAGNGSVLWRLPEWQGIVGVSSAPGGVVVASADRGVACIDAATQAPRWTYESVRGTASPPTTSGPLLLFGESHGSFIALDLETGQELSRVDAGHGFEALPAIDDGLGYVMSNGGTLLALRVAQ